MSVYPEKIQKSIDRVEEKRQFAPFTKGRGADFLCGVTIEFRISIDEDTLQLNEADFVTNGCGFVIASASEVSKAVRGIRITDLSGIKGVEAIVENELGSFPEDRQHCLSLAVDAFLDSLAEFRLQRIKSWNGDDALVCSCFGVSEGEIESAIESRSLDSVEAVGDTTLAGTGCGSCQQVITEILDGNDL